MATRPSDHPISLHTSAFARLGFAIYTSMVCLLRGAYGFLHVKCITSCGATRDCENGSSSFTVATVTSSRKAGQSLAAR